MKFKTAESLYQKFKAAGLPVWIVNNCALWIDGRIVSSANKATAILRKCVQK